MKKAQTFLAAALFAVFGVFANGTYLDVDQNCSWDYEVVGSEARILAYHANGTVVASGLVSVSIPASIVDSGSGALSVTSLGSGVFRDAPSGLSIRVPSGIQSVGQAAFVRIDATDAARPVGEVVYENHAARIDLYAFVSGVTGKAVDDACFPGSVKVCKNGIDVAPTGWRGDDDVAYATLMAALAADRKGGFAAVLPSYAVVFVMNGGSPAVAPQTVGAAEPVAVPPTVPEKTGYAFGGWFSDVALTVPYDFATPVTAPVTIFAKWKAFSVPETQVWTPTEPILQEASIGESVLTFDDPGTDDLPVVARLAEDISSMTDVTSVFFGQMKGYSGVTNVVMVTDEQGGKYVDIRDFENNKAYRIHIAPDGTQTVEAFTPRPEGMPLALDEAIARPGAPEERSVASASFALAPAEAGMAVGLPHVDVLVAYDLNASAWVASRGETLDGFGALQVERMNVVLSNSGLASKFRFKYAGSVAVAASGGSDFNGTLNKATDGVGAWKVVGQKREEVGADVVSILIDTGSEYGQTGLGWSLTRNSPAYLAWFAEAPYNVCSIRSVANSYTMLHEIGHNMGAGHPDSSHMGAHDCGPQLGSASCGHYFFANGKPYFTVMGYNYDNDGNYYYEVPYFSTPKRSYKGTPVGDGRHDNVRTLESTYLAVSQFRSPAIPKPVDPDPAEPDPTEPDPTEPDPTEPQPDDGQPSLYASAVSTPFAGDSTYYGWVRGADGVIEGSLMIKAAKAAKPEKGGQSKLTIQYTPFGGKKQTIKLGNSAMPVAGGNPSVAIPGLGTVKFGGASLAGVGFKLQAGKDLAKSKDKTEKTLATARLAAMDGAWTFALATDAGDAAFSVTVKKGKGKLSGTLPDGSKVSVSAAGVLGESALAIPFVYAKKGSVGLVFWVADDGTAKVSDMTALKLADGSVFNPVLVEPSKSIKLADGEHSFTVSALDICQSFTSVGKKWTFPKHVAKPTPEKPDLNPASVKLTITEKTGLVKGTFTLVDTAGKKQKYTVNGAVVGGKLCGSALLNKVGSVRCAAE